MGTLEEICREAGAIAYGVVYPEDVDCDALRRYYSSWLNSGNAGTLNYIDERLQELCHPFDFRKQAQCALVIAFLPRRDEASPLLRLPPAVAGTVSISIAGYAMMEDYHITGMSILNRIAASLDCWHEACVDAAPVPEKFFAGVARLGERGINSLIRLDGFGCRIHLGVLFLGERLSKPAWQLKQAQKECCRCMQCVRQCPGRALTEDGRIDVHLCRSWLAGQKRGALSKAEQSLLGNVLFGCSICSSCCPDDNGASNDYCVDAEKLFFMPSSELRRIIAGTALEHTGVTMLKRNAASAICQAKPGMAQQLLNATESSAIRETISCWL